MLLLTEGFSNWISTSCKGIKEIKLEVVRAENISIDIISFESFNFRASVWYHLHCVKISGEKLKRIQVEWENYFPASKKSLHICASNLKSLKWTGSLLSNHKFSEFSCLEKAEISLDSKSDTHCDYHDRFKLLCSISKVKELIINDWAIKALFGEGSMAAPLFDTSSLRLCIPYMDNTLVPAMVSLMRGMSNLNILDIKSNFPFWKRKSCGFSGNYWKSKKLDFVHQLKEVTIEWSYGNNSWQLARFILEHAKNLKMEICYLPGKHYVIDKLHKCKKVSSATICGNERVRTEKKN